MSKWVVTYTIEFANSDVMVTEFYRGELEECVRICRNSGGGEHDTMQTKQPWRPVFGPAHEWDEFLES